MKTLPSMPWSRRAWLTQTSRATALAALAPRPVLALMAPSRAQPQRQRPAHALCPDLPSTDPVPPGPMQALALRAVEAAMADGAQYADARLTRTVQHRYHCIGAYFDQDIELVAVGVRVLVNGYWGFAASPFRTPTEVTQLATNAVAQAKSNAKGPPRAVDLGHIPVVTGTWATPVRIDPFKIPIEEKRDYITYWKSLAAQHYVPFYQDGFGSGMDFVRQERVLATSEGSLVTQTCYESAGNITCGLGGNGVGGFGSPTTEEVQGIGRAAKGWELFLDAKLPEQFVKMKEDLLHPPRRIAAKAALVGRYTIVCDGVTMASLVEQTMGLATQLDRALGYEANASGTSFLDDPLGMIGTTQVASPLVTITANRSAPAQLATVKWDDEGLVPPDVTLIKDGLLVDFQTTREQAAWLAPYYTKHGKPVRSNGCAAAEDGLNITMQMMPNLAMTPGASALALTDLVADVVDGVLIEGGSAQCDWQSRGGLLQGSMREIKNGRLGASLTHGAILFDTEDLWKKVVAVGGAATQGGIDKTQYTLFGREEKGQPPQATSHSVRAVAATITNQPLVDPTRKA